MKRKLAAAGVSAIATLWLSACGGGAPSSTPPPTGSTPTPTPTASYQTLDQLGGDRTYQSAGVNVGTSATDSGKTYKFGAGSTLAYNAASDSYTLSSPDGYTAMMSAANIVGPQSGTSQTFYSKTDGTTTDNVVLIRPAVNGVTLSYLLLASWAHLGPGGGRIDLALGGIPTLASDVPKSGTADYDLAIAGSAILLASGTAYSLSGASNSTQSTGSFSVNFSTGSLTTSMALVGVATTQPGGPPLTLGTFSGSGALDSGGPGFSGIFAGTTASGFSGALFGPAGKEAAYGWFIQTQDMDARGLNTAVKKGS